MIKINDLTHIAFWIVVGAGGMWLYQLQPQSAKTTAVSTAKTSERTQQNLAVVKAGPTAVAYGTAEGEIVKLSIPTSQLNGLILNTQKCIVWRDHQTNTSSMSCDKEEVDFESGDPGIADEPSR